MVTITKKSIFFGTGIAAISLLVGFSLGYVSRLKSIANYINNFKPYRISVEGYPFISPLVGVESPSSVTVGLNIPLYIKLQEISYTFVHQNGLTDFAIYYRDLNSSSWFGINEDKDFIPASLLKISYAIAAYKENEDETGFLNTKILYTGELASINKKNKQFKPSVLEIGTSYSVAELIKIMIVHSDNSARDMLAATVKKKYVSDIYQLFGMHDPDSKVAFTISTKEYSLFLRMLYSATYLTNSDSNELLSYLNQTDFTAGLVAGLPSDVQIAHKYGLYSNIENDKETYKELHDCGIIYETVHPYVLCVMSKGQDEETLKEFVSVVSGEVYKYVHTDDI